jgi:hypothetical protein
MSPLLICLISVLIDIVRGLSYDHASDAILYTMSSSTNPLPNATFDVPIYENGDLIQQNGEYIYILTRRTWDPTDYANYPIFTLYSQLMLHPYTYTILVFLI